MDEFGKSFKGAKILYRGQKYKVQEIKQGIINKTLVTMLRIPDKKYKIWVNAKHVIKC